MREREAREFLMPSDLVHVYHVRVLEVIGVYGSGRNGNARES